MTPEQARRELTKEIETRLRLHPISSVWLAAAIEALIDAKLKPQGIMPADVAPIQRPSVIAKEECDMKCGKNYHGPCLASDCPRRLENQS